VRALRTVAVADQIAVPLNSEPASLGFGVVRNG